jgi:hypothetical protein
MLRSNLRLQNPRLDDRRFAERAGLVEPLLKDRLPNLIHKPLEL